MEQELEDVDNPRDLFERYGREEEQRTAEQEEEEHEAGFLELEETDIDPSILEDEEAVVQESRKLSPENGAATGTVYDLVLNEIEQIYGFNPDSCEVDLYGEIVDGEISLDEVSAVYRLDEQLVNTSGEIMIPGLDFADEETLALAYKRDGLDVGIQREDGSYIVKAKYEEPEDLEKAARKVAVAIAEFEDEFTSAYGV